MFQHTDMPEDMKTETMELIVASCEKHPSNNEVCSVFIFLNIRAVKKNFQLFFTAQLNIYDNVINSIPILLLQILLVFFKLINMF